MEENVAWLRAEVADGAGRAGMGPAQVGDVRLAASEAIANVVQHAYAGRAGGLVAVEASIEGDAFVVTVRDAGAGVRPRPRGEEARYGLTLIAAVCDLAVTRPAGGGLCVEMRFTLGSDRAQAA